MKEIAYVQFELAFTPRACAMLEPHVRQAADDEIDDENVRMELLNFANELAAVLQRAVTHR